MMLNNRKMEKEFAPPNKLRKLNNRSVTGNKCTGGSGDADSSNVNVFVRVRPANEKELSENFRTVVKVLDEKLLVFDPKEEQEPFFFRGTKQKIRDIAKKQNKQLEFLFDGVFGPDVRNWDIHCKTTQNIIGRLLEGYNCSVFVYGATGAGKTFTMLGKGEQCKGIMYHTMAQLYNQIESISNEKECHVGVSFVEVYNENVFDLLHPSGPLYLREDSSGVSIVGLKVENINNADHLLQKLAEGNNNRTQHPTDANAESSRSHAVFQVYVRMMAKNNGEVKIAKLSMIDLAGSERGMATGCKGMRFKEGSNINKSLLALGNCISNLADNLRHIPYRDSKLTRLLKDSLGGNCQTVMIANISPSSASYEDTYNTLKFASRAKKITTKLRKNILSSDMGVNHYMQLVERLEAENTLLKSKIRALEMTATDSARACMNMPDISVWCNHLTVLFDEKIILVRRLLKVKSEAHLLEWRINLGNDKLKNIQVNWSSLVGRIESSVGKYQERLNALQSCINDLNSQLKNNNDKLTKLLNEMEEARVIQYMKKDLELKSSSLHNTIQEATIQHLNKLLLLLQKRSETSETALKMSEPLLHDYHRLLSGLNVVTKSMTSDYESAIKAIDGIKTVSWRDIEEKASSNILSVVNLSFDDSLLTIDSHHQTQKLEPTVLPIMDIKDDEIVDSNENSMEITKQTSSQVDENNTIVVTNGENNEVSNINENKTDDNDSVNSTITLDMPSILTSFSTIPSDAVGDPLLLPQITDADSSQLPSSTADNLNETVTIKTNCELSTNQLPQLNKNNNGKETSASVKVKKIQPGFVLLRSVKKYNSQPMQRRNNQENVILKNSNFKIGIAEKNNDTIFKLPIMKTPGIKKKQQPIEKFPSAMRALRPIDNKPATGTNPITKQAASIQSLKITGSKSRVKSHPYQRPGENFKTIHKRR